MHGDPYTPDQKRFECRDCHRRLQSTHHAYACPDCGGPLRNVAVPRE